MKKIIRLTESDLKRIVKESVNRVLRESHEQDFLEEILQEANWYDGIYKRELNEKIYNPLTEPMVDGRIGEYDVLEGSYMEQVLCDIPQKGEVEDIRMYSNMKNGGKTYALFRRRDNWKYFFVEIFSNEDDEFLHTKLVQKEDIPFIIWNDAVSLIWNNQILQDFPI